MADKRAGSLAYNRLDFQISQVFHLAIQLYESLDYLFVLDHDDDITLFDDEEKHDVVSYYQVKTTDSYILLNEAIREGWIEKLYSHINESDIAIRELGLITNCPIKVEDSFLAAEKTSFNDFADDAIRKIKHNIADKTGLPLEDIDLSRMHHVRSNLSIDEHRRIVRDEASEFLANHFPSIKVQVVKAIVAAVFEFLEQKQRYERLPNTAPHDKVVSRKGFTRQNFKDIIANAVKIHIPEYDAIVRASDMPSNLEQPAALSYTKVSADSRSNLESFSTLFESLEKIIAENDIEKNETLWDYAVRCRIKWSQQKKYSSKIYGDDFYIEIFVICICLATEGVTV
jgi:hypothetical protein